MFLFEQCLQALEIKRGKIDPLSLLARFVDEDEVGVVVWHVVDTDAHVKVSIAGILNESPDVRQLVQASSRACADLSLKYLRLLLLETLFLHQLVESIARIRPEVQALNLLPVLVEKDEVRVVMWNEVDLQTFVRVSVARILDEFPSFR